jgi:CspA family cold shock protein
MSSVMGKVEWFNAAKGYGFLSYEGGHDVFVHHTNIEWRDSKPFVKAKP